MGTHPIFESDFDCLTDSKQMLKNDITGTLTEDEENSNFPIIFISTFVFIIFMIWIYYNFAPILRRCQDPDDDYEVHLLTVRPSSSC